MTISCALCEYQFSSLLIIPEQALQEVCNKMSGHFTKHHGIQVKEIAIDHAKLINILVWYIMMQKYVTWKDEPFIQNEFNKWTTEINKMLGWTVPTLTEINKNATTNN